MTEDEKNREHVNGQYDSDTKRYIYFMCKKGCQFYSEEGCTKKRVVRECAKKGLKNRE